MLAARRDDDHVKFLGDPLPVPRFGGAATAASIVEVLSPRSRGGRRVSGFNLLGSHDTSRFRTVCGDADRQIAGAGLLFTLPGVPMVFAGDEVGLTGVDGDGARQPMPWDAERWDRDVLDAYRALGALRRVVAALRHGGLRWVHADDDVLVYLRESTRRAAARPGRPAPTTSRSRSTARRSTATSATPLTATADAVGARRRGRAARRRRRRARLGARTVMAES